MKTISVQLPENSYNIHVEKGIINNLNEYLKPIISKSKCLIISDENVFKLYGEKIVCQISKLKNEVATFIFKPGEESKNISTINEIYRFMAQQRLERSSIVIALGGGVVGDIAGFAAATYMRGINYIQIPTSLLAMVDSSVGGKTGFDLPEGKNLIGAFWQPKCVIIDPEVLITIPNRELLAGLAEIVKYGIIKDIKFFEILESNTLKLLRPDIDFYIDIIAQCCKIKSDIVIADEKELSVRALLNLGHTFGHAIESVSGYSKYLHGEGVAIGIAMASELALLLNMIDFVSKQRIIDLLLKLGLPISAQGLSTHQLIDAMKVDKKIQENKINFILPNIKIGNAIKISNINERYLIEAMDKCL